MSFTANTPEQQKAMLKDCGVSGIEELFQDIPKEVAPKSFELPRAHAEMEIQQLFDDIAAKNYTHLTKFLGGGYYDHFIPAAVDDLAGRSEFYTAYTPYQPELSQGTLQAIYEYQTQICRLTDMEVSNASVYDGGTALYEACQMALKQTKRNKVVLDSGVNPVYRNMLHSYTANLSIDFATTEVTHGQSNREKLFSELDDSTAAVILQNPNFFGAIDDHSDIVEHCHKKGILVIQSIYPVAMTLLKTPGEMGVDIATGEGQSLGIPLSFGGPYLGFIASRKKLARKLPGRIAGRTTDAAGEETFALTLQAREQHIRRHKATSNICTNQALCALRAHIYLSLLGKEGVKEIATLCHSKAQHTKRRLQQTPGVEVKESSPTFNEFTLELPTNAEDVVGKLVERGIAPGLPLGQYYNGMENFLLVAVTEKRTKYEMGMFAEILEDTICQ